MNRPDRPVKVVLTASICLVASSALQGTTTTVQAKPEQRWQAAQRSIEKEAARIVEAKNTKQPTDDKAGWGIFVPGVPPPPPPSPPVPDMRKKTTVKSAPTKSKRDK